MPRTPDVEAAEVRPGLVLHLCPAELEAEGAVYTCRRRHRVVGRRLFLCVSLQGRSSLWLPLYGTASSRHRIPVSREGRTGTEFWRDASLYWDTRQVWSVPDTALRPAAEKGGDLTTPLNRNRLREEHLPAAWRKRP